MYSSFCYVYVYVSLLFTSSVLLLFYCSRQYEYLFRLALMSGTVLCSQVLSHCGNSRKLHLHYILYISVIAWRRHVWFQ